jgi:hypothetical protein
MDEHRVCIGAAPGESLDRSGVHRERLVLLALANLHVVESRAVEHDRWAMRGKNRLHCVVVGDVEVDMGQREHLLAVLQQSDEIGRQLATCPRDENSLPAHRATRNWSIWGVSSLRSSIQRML